MYVDRVKSSHITDSPVAEYSGYYPAGILISPDPLVCVYMGMHALHRGSTHRYWYHKSRIDHGRAPRLSLSSDRTSYSGFLMVVALADFS